MIETRELRRDRKIAATPHMRCILCDRQVPSFAMPDHMEDEHQRSAATDSEPISTPAGRS